MSKKRPARRVARAKLRTWHCIGLALAGVGLGAAPARAETAKGSSQPVASSKDHRTDLWSIEAELDFVSRYAWHGVVLSDGPVLQPSVTGEIIGISLTAWTNLVLGADPHAGKFTQVGLELAYEWTWKRLTIEPQLCWVDQLAAQVTNGLFSPDLAGYQNTAKLGLELSYEIGAKVSVLTRHLVDVAAFKGGYFGDLGVDFAPELKRWHLAFDGLATVGFASASFNEEFFGVDKAALNVFEFEASVTWSPVGPLYVRGHFELSVLIDPDLRSSANEAARGLCGRGAAVACNAVGGNFNSPTVVTGGAAVGVKF